MPRSTRGGGCGSLSRHGRKTGGIGWFWSLPGNENHRKPHIYSHFNELIILNP